MEPTVICDIDGTIANKEHREHLVTGNNKKWEEFYSLVLKDEPIWPVINVFNALQQAGYTGLLCSGRSDNWKDDTVAWLARYDIRYSGLYMRRHGDYRDDVTVKLEMLTQIRQDGFNPSVALDDRNKVVEMWRKEGIICLQAAEGDF